MRNAWWAEVGYNLPDKNQMLSTLVLWSMTDVRRFLKMAVLWIEWFVSLIVSIISIVFMLMVAYWTTNAQLSYMRQHWTVVQVWWRVMIHVFSLWCRTLISNTLCCLFRLIRSNTWQHNDIALATQTDPTTTTTTTTTTTSGAARRICHKLTL
jgi:hypothetical protein